MLDHVIWVICFLYFVNFNRKVIIIAEIVLVSFSIFRLISFIVEFVIDVLVELFSNLICMLSAIACTFWLNHSVIQTLVCVLELLPGLWISRRSSNSFLSSLKSSSTPVKPIYINWLGFGQLLLKFHHFLDLFHNSVGFALLELELLILQLMCNSWLDIFAQVYS
jgi:hypothetical protein